MSAWTRPTVDDFKDRFKRDFRYAPTGDAENLDFVTDGDITNALDMAEANFNQSLFGTEDQITQAFLWLAAFYLVSMLQVSAEGISSQSNFPINAQSVGGVSLSFQIPEKYAKSPALSIFMGNGYGRMYLSLAIPQLAGNVSVVRGTTTST